MRGQGCPRTVTYFIQIAHEYKINCPYNLAGAFRRDELASIDLAHLRFDDDGLVVELPKSKTNQKGEAEEKAIFFAPDRRSCPVRAVKDWLELLQQHGRTS
jgi:hypothetical protein